MARFTPFRPEVLGLRAAVRNQPQQATAFTKAVMGMIDRDVFFNPENLQWVVVGAPTFALRAPAGKASPEASPEPRAPSPEPRAPTLEG